MLYRNRSTSSNGINPLLSLSMQADLRWLASIRSPMAKEGIASCISFRQAKKTQQNWTLKKCRAWIFGGPEVILYSDHKRVTYLTMTAPRNAKLRRWSLALQDFDNLVIKYKVGKTNLAADYLSRAGCEILVWRPTYPRLGQVKSYGSLYVNTH